MTAIENAAYIQSGAAVLLFLVTIWYINEVRNTNKLSILPKIKLQWKADETNNILSIWQKRLILR